MPQVRTGVRWNSSFYGVEDQGRFSASSPVPQDRIYSLGLSLVPLPPAGSEQHAVRYLTVFEDDQIDEKQLVNWIQQGSAIPASSCSDPICQDRLS